MNPQQPEPLSPTQAWEIVVNYYNTSTHPGCTGRDHQMVVAALQVLRPPTPQPADIEPPEAK